MKITWHTNPDEAVREKCRYLEKVRKKEGQTAYWNIVRVLLKTDPWFMMRVALEWAWLDEDLVGTKLIGHLATHWGEDIAVLLPRGFGKTLPMSAVIMTNIVANPNVAILEISRTEGNANKFGEMVSSYLMYNDFLQRCFGTKFNKEKENAILPSSTAECTMWGRDGYSLPRRRPRLDPTLLCIPSKGAKAGKHPDWIYVDDPIEEENNNPQGWEDTEKLIMGGAMLLPADGHFVWTGTRWHDADTLGKAEAGTLHGKQGKFHTLKVSCYVNDNPAMGVTYPRKKRWNMTTETGYTQEALDAKRKPKDEGGYGEFFDAQMRNDPAPIERADIKIKDIAIYERDSLPEMGVVRTVGIEVTGGGLPIYNGLAEKCDELKIPIPIQTITNPKTRGLTKRDRIVAALQPLTQSGRIWAQDWMIGDEYSTDNLGYQLRRLGKATHDDIADCLHNIVVHLIAGGKPDPGEAAHLYIGVDLAYSENTRSDFTVIMAVAVDHKGVIWIVDYEQFQISSPTGIYDRIIAFYRKYDESQTIRRRSTRKYPGAWR